MKKLHKQKSKATPQHNLKVSMLYGAMVLALSATSMQVAASNGQNRPYQVQRIGDLEVYTPPAKQPVVITMMLDNSGSMGSGSIAEDYPNIRCGSITTGTRESVTVYDDNGNATSTTISFPVAYCQVNGTKYYDRMSRLKRALMPVFANPKAYIKYPKVHTDYKIGLGGFRTYHDGNVILPIGDNNYRGRYNGGRIISPARSLTLDNRIALLREIANIEANSNTPIANAYAEAGAYMMGTSTVITDGNLVNLRSDVTQRSAYTGREFSGIAAKNSPSNSNTFTGTKYNSPVTTTDQCEGRGIYFLTDGEPTMNPPGVTEKLMTESLKGAITIPLQKSPTPATFPANNAITTTTPLRNTTKSNASYTYHGWQLTGDYAKHLYNKELNPLGVEIKTATVGLGKVFEAASKQKNELTKSYNCYLIDGVTEPDAQNLCRLGEKGFGFGEGGFDYAEEPEHIEESFRDFLDGFGEAIEPVPGGTISIPNDPLNALRRLPYAYLPMVQPEVTRNLSKWEGNLKKYDTLFGTLYGKNGARLYVRRVTGATLGNEDYPSRLNNLAQDLWQTRDYVIGKDENGRDIIANDRAEAGGTRNLLPVPANARQVTSNGSTTAIPAVTDSRVVYVEDGVGVLRRLQVRNRNMDGFDRLSATYSVLDMAYILNFMGYQVSVNQADYPINNRATALTNLRTNLRNAPFTGNPVMGGVVHSSPVLASYGGPIGSDGQVSSNSEHRDEFLLYGSMDGALHAVDAHTGVEAFAFIPRAMFANTDQRQALLYNSEHASALIGQPSFGVDAPWTTIADYRQNSNRTRLEATRISAYGGLRMGGVGLYGLRLHGNNASINNPQLQFVITQTGQFARLGQTWSKPVEATIKTGPRRTDVQRVLVFSGGYDMCYENPEFRLGQSHAANGVDNTGVSCNNKTAAFGNAIYMIDAERGTLLQVWSNAGGQTLRGQRDDRRNMTHSFVSEPVVRDRNNNGYADVIYASDLGGQIFRIDLAEEVAASRMTRRVVRLFSANESNDRPANIPYRFYESPMVSFYNHDNATLALINISSGDRSSPVHDKRTVGNAANIANNANRIYGIFDRDITTERFYTGENLSTTLNHSHLIAYDTAVLAGGDASNQTRRDFMDRLKNQTMHGWYYTMDRFENRTDVPHLKAIGSSVVSGGIYFTSIYNPNYEYFKAGTCDAKILGATERQLFCLPWGICAEPNGALIPQSNNGTLGYIKAGPGIQELAMTTVTGAPNTATNLTTIISHQTIAERISTQKPGQPTADGSNTPATTTGTFEGPGFGGPTQDKGIVASDYVLRVDRWYDLQTAGDNQ